MIAALEREPRTLSSQEPLTEEQRVRLLRQLTGAQPIVRWEIPHWVRRRMLERFGRPGWESLETQDILRRVLAQIEPSKTGSFFDHWGWRMTGDGREIFVCEPYPNRGDDFRSAQAFADALGIELVITATTWHCPGHTVGLLFFEQREAAPESNGWKSAA